ncbi:glycosyltransferase [Pseudomonas gregormendelii]
MEPKCLVLLAAYNGMQWISEQVDSILQQSGVSVTLLISVDRSTDGTEEWVSHLASVNPNVRHLQHGEKFGGAARNFFRLINEAPLDSFDYFAFADQDDIWSPEKLSRAFECITTEGADGYSGNVTAFWPDGREALIEKSQPQVSYDHLFESAGPGCTFVFTRELFESFQLHISSHYAEVQRVSLHDWYAYAFSRASGYKWVIDTSSYMRYRQHDSNEFGANTGLTALTSRLAKVRNGWWLDQAATISRLVGLENDAFVRRWIDLRRGGLLILSLNGFKCRRRPRDKIIFSLLCLMVAFFGRKK